MNRWRRLANGLLNDGDDTEAGSDDDPSDRADDLGDEQTIYPPVVRK